MPWYALLAITLVVLLAVAVLLVSFRIARGAYHPRRWSMLETRQMERERTPDVMADYEAWEKYPWTIASPHGYDLAGEWIPSADPASAAPRRVAVLAHGYTYTRHGSVKYASILKDLGYDLVLYDERFHGESGGANCTMGAFEKDDLRAVVDAVCARFGDATYVATAGESMGAATALLEQADDPRIRFVLSDCAFATLHGQFRHLVRRARWIPLWPCLPLGEWLFAKITGAAVPAISPLAAVARASAPILFIHGAEDRFVPPSCAEALAAACASPHQLWIAGNGARHAESFRLNRDEYVATVRRFLAAYAPRS